MLTAATAAVFVSIASQALAAGTNIPHGGYNTTTDACLQCHDIHEASGDYVLSRWRTVADTCGSCHYLYKTLPGNLTGYTSHSPASGAGGSYDTTGVAPAYDPGYAGQEAAPPGNSDPSRNSVGAPTSAYEVDGQYDLDKPGHNLSRGPGMWQFNDGRTDDAGYIPGGNSRLTAIKKTDYPNTVSTLAYGATAGLYCASCHTPHGNFGQLLVNSTGGPASDKILSSRPNHSGAALTLNWPADGGLWCLACHDRRAEGAVDPATGNVLHNHPHFVCLNCHGNYAGANTALAGNTDFPHTSNVINLLTNEPDALCITCHVSGSLP